MKTLELNIEGIDQIIKYNVEEIGSVLNLEEDVISILNSEYTQDALYEMANNLADDYDDDLLDWAKDHVYEVNQALKDIKLDSIINYIHYAKTSLIASELNIDLDHAIEEIKQLSWVDCVDINIIEEIKDEILNSKDAFITKAIEKRIEDDEDELREFVKEELSKISDELLVY